MKSVYDMTVDELYAELVDEYGDMPSREKMSTSRSREVNYNMATLKRKEGTLNRYRKEGLLR